MSSIDNDPEKIGLVNMFKFIKTLKCTARKSMKGNVVHGMLAGMITAIVIDNGLLSLFTSWQWTLGMVIFYFLVIGPLEVGATRYFYLKSLL